MPLLRRVRRVEYPDLLPSLFLFGDELQMPRRRLIVIVRLATVEDDMQCDVKVTVVDRAGKVFDECADAEILSSRMAVQVFMASINQRLN